jgi:membrane glycosyltransferase
MNNIPNPSIPYSDSKRENALLSKTNKRLTPTVSRCDDRLHERNSHQESRPIFGAQKIRAARMRSMPEIRRRSMKPAVVDRWPVRRLWNRVFLRAARSADEHPPASLSQSKSSPLAGWRASAKRRRTTLALLVLAQTALASWSIARTFPSPALSNLEIAIVINFAVLFSWISFSFWSNVAGFCSLWRNSKKFAVIELLNASAEPLHSRTAVLMPICNEDVVRCCAGMSAIYESVAATGEIEKFDFYMLSDTGDAARQKQEEQEWEKICRTLGGFGRIFYRHRRVNIKRKSGNIADFLRRWSRNYDYMIVLDADSLMSGDMILRLARSMEQSPNVGMIQTTPTIVNRESLFARVQQFASRVYGPLFTASLHFWQLGESYYWGHNAIIRVETFVEHCGLARLPGDPPLGGEILSHDFVEAALMGRAGFEIWLAHDWTGSYEESPPNILDELKRDRRWCQGNLQHLRLLFGDRIRSGHRAIMAMGIMAYASALFWAMFLVFSSAEVIVQSTTTPVYFSPQPSLFPLWPVWHPELTLALLTTTGVLLVLPKLLSYALILKRREGAAFGGPGRLLLGIAMEIVFSTLMAPLRLWFHCKFVLLTLLGRQIKWNAQARNSETGWAEAVDQHGLATLLAVSWMAAAISWNATLAWWLLPVSLPLIIAVPLSVYSSRLAVGRAIQSWQLFRIPEEGAAPPVVERLQQLCAAQQHDRHTEDQSSSWRLFARESSAEPS